MTEQIQDNEDIKIPMTPFVSLNIDGTFSLTELGVELAAKVGDAISETAAGASVEVDGQLEDVKYLDLHIVLDIINQDIGKVVDADFKAMQAAQEGQSEGEEA